MTIPPTPPKVSKLEIEKPKCWAGTDGFGRSDTRENLRRFFEVDRHYIVLTAIRALTTDGKMEKDAILKVIKKYKIDPDKPSPVKV